MRNDWNADDPRPRPGAMALWTAVGLVALAAGARLLFLPIPNFAPMAAMALFGGSVLRRPLFAFGVPLLALGLSDLVVNGMMVGNPLAPPNPWVYGSFVLIGLLGLTLGRRLSISAVAGASLASSGIFFVATNFGVWAAGMLYPRTGAGLAACYTAAIPFLGNTIAGDLFWNAVLFGAYLSITRRLEPRAVS